MTRSAASRSHDIIFIMTVSTIKMTARQFLELGEDPPGVRLELVNGEVAVSPSPIPEHSKVVVELTTILNNHIHKKKLGNLFADVDTIFGKHDVRRPDLLFFAQKRRNLIGKKAMEGPPDLAVEVINPGSIGIDRRDKFKQYAAGGVAFYWIIDPQDRTIEAFRPVGGKFVECGRGKRNDTVRLAPFEDLKIPLSKLWWS
jgi:Uma2 family endonuclease